MRLGAWSHLCHCFSGLSVPLGSRYVAVISDMPAARDVATHVDISSIQSHGRYCIIVYLCGYGFWVSPVYRRALLCLSGNDARTPCQGKLKNPFTYLSCSRETVKVMRSS